MVKNQRCRATGSAEAEAAEALSSAGKSADSESQPKSAVIRRMMNEHGVAITEEAVALANGIGIGSQQHVFLAEGAYQH